MMLQGKAIKILIFDVGTASCHQLICLCVTAGMPVHCLRVSKVTCWLFFYLTEIAWDQASSLCGVHAKAGFISDSLHCFESLQGDMNRQGQRMRYSKILLSINIFKKTNTKNCGPANPTSLIIHIISAHIFMLQLHVLLNIRKKREFGVTQQNESDSHLAAYLA